MKIYIIRHGETFFNERGLLQGWTDNDLNGVGTALAEYPTEYVQERFRKITSEHIEKVLDGIKENTTRVFNTKAYLMAALFNVVSTIDNHYAMLVNHDFYGG